MEQRQLEATGKEIGIRVYRDRYQSAWEGGHDLTVYHPEMKLLRKCLHPVAKAIKKRIQENDNMAINQHLGNIDPTELAFITSWHCINLISAIEAINATYRKLAIKIARHSDYDRFRREAPGLFKQINYAYRSETPRYRRSNLQERWQSSGIIDTDWDSTIRLAVGRELITIFIEATGFFKVRETDGYQYLKPIDALIDWLVVEHAKYEQSQYVKLPMVITPLTWFGAYNGGYHHMRLPIIKDRRKVCLDLAESSKGFERVCRAINAIQETPWRINKMVFETLKSCYGTTICGLPLMELALPLAPWKDDTDKECIKRDRPEAYHEYRNIIYSVNDRWKRDRPDRQKLRYQLWMADQFKDEPELYFPWNMDWRGRMYPLFTVAVHPQADDVGKALIEFARGKRLGTSGAYWLAVHGANCFGEDKKSLNDRVRWVQDHEPEIIASAIDPMRGQKFWAEADNPFQFLAFCFEWNEYKKQGENFESHIPVSIDMSCNGLQHLSYFAKDWKLSLGVNALIKVPRDQKPIDFYGIIAERVKEVVEKDAKEGHEIAQVWVGKVDRSIVKRNVMTLPYGATLEGFKNQLMDELKKRDNKAEGGSYLGVKANWEVCGYLAEKNRKAINSISGKLSKTMKGMQRFSELVARTGFLGHAILSKGLTISEEKAIVEAKDTGLPYPWVTPIGLTVHQEYRKPVKTKRIDTFWGDIRVKLSNKYKIDVNSSKNGIVPNMIHSHDASHMMLTVLKMLENGIDDFCMVHDSFGCHAVDAERMDEIIWDVFAGMYGEQRGAYKEPINDLLTKLQ